MADGKAPLTREDKQKLYDEIQQFRDEAERTFVRHFVEGMAPDSTLSPKRRRDFAKEEFFRRLDAVLAGVKKIVTRRLGGQQQAEDYLNNFVDWNAVNNQRFGLAKATLSELPGPTQTPVLKNLESIRYTLVQITTGQNSRFPEIPKNEYPQGTVEEPAAPAKTPGSAKPAPAAKKGVFGVIEGGKSSSPKRPGPPKKKGPDNDEPKGGR